MSREQRLKVLLAAGEPNYDYRFLKDLLQREASIELRVFAARCGCRIQRNQCAWRDDFAAVVSVDGRGAKELRRGDFFVISTRGAVDKMQASTWPSMCADGGGSGHAPRTAALASGGSSIGLRGNSCPIGLEQAAWSEALTDSKFAWHAEPSLLGPVQGGAATRGETRRQRPLVARSAWDPLVFSA
jgi:hypothetical protein